jgi:hypothetical protein
MDASNYFLSLSLELDALKDRIRNFIDDAHWLTDGEWKETVLRAMLRRNMPASAVIGRGFIITPERVSSQIDILIYDSLKPVLFREGDLAFITPDAAKIVTEVKTRVTRTTLEETLLKLSANAELCRMHFGQRIMFSIFSYEASNIAAMDVLGILQQVANGKQARRIDCISLGTDLFFRYWRMDPLRRTRRPYDRWHAYQLPRLALGYFIHNLIERMDPESINLNNDMWYPRQGKEPFLVAEMPFHPNA